MPCFFVPFQKLSVCDFDWHLSSAKVRPTYCPSYASWSFLKSTQNSNQTRPLTDVCICAVAPPFSAYVLLLACILCPLFLLLNSANIYISISKKKNLSIKLLLSPTIKCDTSASQFLYHFIALMAFRIFCFLIYFVCILIPFPPPRNKTPSRQCVNYLCISWLGISTISSEIIFFICCFLFISLFLKLVSDIQNNTINS